MNRQFVEQLLAAGRIKDRSKPFTIEEDGREVTFTLVPMKDSEVIEYLESLKEGENKTDGQLIAARNAIVKYVKEFAEMDQRALDVLGELSKWDAVSQFISYGNQFLIARAIMDYSDQAKKDPAQNFEAQVK